MKKILLFALNGRGGMLHYTSQYANALSKKAKVYVVLPSYSDTSLFDKKVKLIRITAPPHVAGTLFSTLFFWNHKRLLNQIKKLKPDLIHIMDNHPWYVYYSRKLGFPLFVTQHDPQLHSGESRTLRGIVSDYTNKFLRKKADRIIVHGEKLKELLAKNGISKSKIVVVPHGSYEFFTKWQKKGVKAEKHTLLFFGRIVKYKGIDTLLKSIPLVLKEIPDLKVVIAGEGDFSIYSKYLTEAIKKNVIVLNRYIPEKEVAELFQKSSFVVLPYDDATQSGIIPIAYSFRKPVITTNVGSLPEVVEDGKTGIIVPPRNPKALAKAIILMFKKDINAMGNNAYAKMKEIMDWGKIVEKVAEGYGAAQIEMPHLLKGIEGNGADTSKKQFCFAKNCIHSYIQPDNNYTLRHKLGEECLDFIANDDLFDTKYYPILLKEWIYCIKKGGHILLQVDLANTDTQFYLGEIQKWTQHHALVESFYEKEGVAYFVLRKTKQNEPASDINKWTFGIITLGKKNDVVEQQIQSIRKQRIPYYEIIICGTYYDRKEKDVKYIHFAQKDDKGWITKKKNIICENAKYPNIMVMHDRIVLDDNWFKGMKKYGNNFEVLCCKIAYKEERAFDWLTVAYPYSDIRSRWYLGGYLKYSDWDPWVYVDGGSITLKRGVWQKVQWDEKLFWGGREDVKLSHEQSMNGLLIRFNQNSSCTSLSFGHPVSRLIRKKNPERLGGYIGPIQLVAAKHALNTLTKLKGALFRIVGATYDPEKGLSWGSNSKK